MIRRRALSSSIGYMAPAALEVLDCRVTQDETSIPWLTVDMTVSRPAEGVRALMDPSAGAIVEVKSAPLDGDLDPATMAEQVLLDTADDVDDDTTRLTAYSHDRRLLDYFPTSETRYWDRQANVYGVVTSVLDRVYGAGRWTRLSSPGAGSGIVATPFRTYQELTNLVPNGGFEGGVTLWNVEPHGVDPKTSTTWKSSGVYSMALVPTPGTTSVANYAEVAISLEPGQTYTMGGVGHIEGVLSGNDGQYARRITIAAKVGGVTQVVAQTDPASNYAAGRTTVLRQKFTTPINASDFTMRIYHGSRPTSTSNAFYVDDVYCFEGTGFESDGVTPIGYFDGSTPAGTNGFNYSWSDTINASPSRRVGVIDRPPEILTWSPSQSAYDFLEPILQVLGWRIIPGGIDRSGTFPVFGFYVVTNKWIGRTGQAASGTFGVNLYGAGQTRSRSGTFSDGVPMYADAVILNYQWKDPQGNDQARLDVYAPAGYTLPYVAQLDEPFPGPGRAEALYRRFQARARRARATLPLHSSVQAGATITLTSPQTGTVLATIDTASIDYVEGVIEIATKAAVDYPSNAWIAATDTWATAPTGSWATDL